VVLPQQRFFCMPFLQLAAIKSVLTGTHPSRPYRPACYVLVGGQRCLTDCANSRGAERRSTVPTRTSDQTPPSTASPSGILLLLIQLDASGNDWPAAPPFRCRSAD
jgi:hypothetical protein